MEIINFDGSSMGHVGDCEMNKAFLDVQKRYLKEKLFYRGYLYLNEVYESFGVRWNPKKANVCWHDKPLSIETEQTGENEFMITVE